MPNIKMCFMFFLLYWGELKWICKGLGMNKTCKGQKNPEPKRKQKVKAFWTLIRLFPTLFMNWEWKKGRGVGTMD
jgi:hypothetical protein